MSNLALEHPADDLYDTDFFNWTQTQAALIRQKRWSALDLENLAEEVELMGGSQRSEIFNRLAIVMEHLLKWEFQPEHRKYGWKASISEQRSCLEEILRSSPSLKRFPTETFDRSYRLARIRASSDTGILERLFPAECPYALADILDHRFYPGPREPWLD
jgi:Domain of unknown function DUF29